VIGSRHQIGPVRVVNRPDAGLWGYTVAGGHRQFVVRSVVFGILIEHLERGCDCSWPLKPLDSD
jgi:hypothetical protein